MQNNKLTHIKMIKTVAKQLEPLQSKFAFLGGVTTGLLITDPAAPEIRPTRDVDIIVEVLTRSAYYKLEETLRSLGFKQSMENDTPICRWFSGSTILDVMPTDEEILGFANRWYLDALQHSIEMEIEKGFKIRIVTAPYFLATKIEAFYGRGQNDFLFSHDMEDIIAIIDGRNEIIKEVNKSPDELKDFLSKSFNTFLQNDAFKESLSGHLSPDSASQARLPILIQRIKNLITTI